MEPPFGLFTSYPRNEIPLSNSETVAQFGLSSGLVIGVEIENGQVEFDPLTIFSGYLEQSVKVIIHFIR